MICFDVKLWMTFCLMAAPYTCFAKYLLPMASADSRRRRPADGRRRRSSAARVSSAAPKKKHLIEAAPFGRLDQMLRTTV